VFGEEISVQSIQKIQALYIKACPDGELRGKLAKYHGWNVDGAFWGWPDCGHTLHKEQKEATFDAMVTFIRGILHEG